jgi:hypothetical protein
MGFFILGHIDLFRLFELMISLQAENLRNRLDFVHYVHQVFLGIDLGSNLLHFFGCAPNVMISPYHYCNFALPESFCWGTIPLEPSIRPLKRFLTHDGHLLFRISGGFLGALIQVQGGHVHLFDSLFWGIFMKCAINACAK